MGTYCNECNRKVRSSDIPKSCDCCHGDGYCYMCRMENEDGIEIYELIEAYDKYSNKLQNVYTKRIEDWCCDSCDIKLEF